MSTRTPKALAVNAAIDILGGTAATASALGVSKQRVSWWRRRGVPLRFAPELERMSGVPCEQLRPDVAWSVLRVAR